MAEHSEGWLFVTMRDESNSAALPLANLWLDLIVGRLLNSASHRRRVWIVVDQLPVPGRQAKLERSVTRGRKRGLAAVLGLEHRPAAPHLWPRAGSGARVHAFDQALAARG